MRELPKQLAKAGLIVVFLVFLLPTALCSYAVIKIIPLLNSLPYPADTDIRYHPENGHPTDTQLADNLRTYQTEFDRLIYLFRQVDQRSSSGYKCEANLLRVQVVSLAACQEFMGLMKTVGVKYVYGEDAIIFVVSERGLGVSGSEKGYVYHSGGKPQMPTSEYYDVRHLQGDWWVYDFAT